MLTLGATYLRIAPNGNKNFIDIETEKQKEYHESLEERGYIYQEQSVSTPASCPSAWVEIE